MTRLVFMALCLALLPGCYYLQAAKGQWELTRKRAPIDEVLASDSTPAELAERLQLVQEARQFAVDELGLPDNDTYRSYADIEREFVVWNVFAAPEFSMRAKTWCFPIVGCVSYRGYFDLADAEREAQRLSRKGYDVAVGGVAAYSTLGKLKDPVLSSMMKWDDVELVGVLFHELAHQVLYVKGDSAFNESFATAVEEFGVLRWLDSRNNTAAKDEYLARRQLRQDLMDLVATARDDLEAIYASDDGGLAQQRSQQRAAGVNDAVRRAAAGVPGFVQTMRGRLRLLLRAGARTNGRLAALPPAPSRDAVLPIHAAARRSCASERSPAPPARA